MVQVGVPNGMPAVGAPEGAVMMMMTPNGMVPMQQVPMMNGAGGCGVQVQPTMMTNGMQACMIAVSCFHCAEEECVCVIAVYTHTPLMFNAFHQFIGCSLFCGLN